jgi:fatty-acid desaturase
MFLPIYQNLKKNSSLLLITIPIMVLGIYGLYDLLMNFTYIKLIFVLLGYFLINVVGVTAGLHRYFSHKSFRISKWKENILLYAAVLSGQGSPVWWAALHRGYHHRHSDKLADPHSPVHGFWHSTVLWIFRIDTESVSFRSVVDLLRKKNVLWFSTHYKTIFLLSNLIFLLIDWQFLLFFSMVPCLMALFTYNITNSITHLPQFGYINFETKDNSVNVPILWPLVLGECWHNNHHARPGNSYFGNQWWELDPSGLFIKLFKDSDR